MKANRLRLLKRISQIILPARVRPAATLAYFGVMSWFYRGDGVACPCCGGHFRQFLPASTGRQNVVCPRCLSLERHRLLWLYFQEKHLFVKPLKLLHIAPELCFYRAFRKMPHLDYLTADLDSPLAAVQMNITAIQYPDNTFDAILCNHVLEHIPDDRLAMAELYRVLKPSGWAILQSPLDVNRLETFEDAAVTTPQQRLAVYGHDDHRRIYGCDYAWRLHEAGFQVSEDSFVDKLDAATVQKWGLRSGEIIYFCTK